MPLIIHDPRLPEGERGRLVEQMVLNIDLAPTLLALAGAAGVASWRRSLRG